MAGGLGRQPATAGQGHGSDDDRDLHAMSQLRVLNDILSRFNALKIDSTEYACLKAIVIFKSG